MNRRESGFVADGFSRLVRSKWYREKQTAMELEARAKYQSELATATSYWQRIKVEVKIEREVRRKLRDVGSPYCLWNSR